jgi:type IV pilus secretin PilQ/predicted competence protein
MMKILIFTAAFLLSSVIYSYAQEVKQEAAAQEAEPVPAETEAGIESPLDTLSAAQNVTMDFKEADIQSVLKIISYKSGVNIVTTPDVMGTVSVRLVDVPWETALDVILKTNGLGWQRQGNVIMVTKQEDIKRIQSEEALGTEIFVLKFLNAQETRKVIVPMLSQRGKISILVAKGLKGWKFSTYQVGKTTVTGEMEKEIDPVLLKRLEKIKQETIAIGPGVQTSPTIKIDFEDPIKSRIIVVTDTPAVLDKVRNFIVEIDKKSLQVLVEARIMEVSRDKLKDIGFDWGLGSTGNAETSTVTTKAISKGPTGLSAQEVGGHILGSEKTPSLFGPLEGTTAFPGTEPYNMGGQLVFKKLTGMQIEGILHALEEDANTNTLSAPRIVTMDNQEASIFVGLHKPILKSVVTAGSTTGTGATITQDLNYYQEIGIRLSVVPQINEEGYVNMIIHPIVTSTSSDVTASSTASGVTTTTNFPIIDVREAQTQVLMKDNETIVLGGLLKDVKSKEIIGIPFLSKLPFLGHLFKREIIDTGKIDLLIFIKTHILKEGEMSEAEIAKLQEELGKDKVTKKDKKKNR